MGDQESNKEIVDQEIKEDQEGQLDNRKQKDQGELNELNELDEQLKSDGRKRPQYYWHRVLLKILAISTIVQFTMNLLIGLMWPVPDTRRPIFLNYFFLIFSIYFIDLIIVIITFYKLGEYFEQNKRTHNILLASFGFISLFTRMFVVGVGTNIVEDTTLVISHYLILFSSALFATMLWRYRNNPIGMVVKTNIQTLSILKFVIPIFVTIFLTLVVQVSALNLSILYIASLGAGGLLLLVITLYSSIFYFYWARRLKHLASIEGEKSSYKLYPDAEV